MSIIRELADITQRISVLLGFDTPADLLNLLGKMLEVSDPPAKVIEDVRAELRRQEAEVGNTLRSILESPPPNLFPCVCQGELKTTRAPCPNCVRINYPSADQLRSATRLEGAPAETGQGELRSEEQMTPGRAELLGRMNDVLLGLDGPHRLTIQAAIDALRADLRRSTNTGPPPTHLAPLVRLSDKPQSSTTKVTRLPVDCVRVDIDGQVYDFGFVQACDLYEDIAAALPAIRWGEGSGPYPGEVVLEQSHPGSRRAAVRPVEGGIALRAVECDGQPAGGSIFLRGGAVDALISALNAARGVRVHEGPALSASGMQALSIHLQDQADRAADPLLTDLAAAGATRFAPAHLTARRCSPTHLQLLDEGVVTADWWPSTGKARAAGPTTGVAAPFKIFTVDALVEWLKGL